MKVNIKELFGQSKLMTLLSAIALVFGFAMSAQAVAEEAAADDVEEIVTVGSRGKPRSVSDTVAPVDVISGDDFLDQGGIDVNNLIRTLVPSLNVNDEPISDAATLVRPVTLRGLAPDHTLVLVNGQRRHRSAVISWLGNGVADGSQGPDLDSLPVLAFKSVEVLRDGAAAQYGSDAIAGVINFQLRDSANDGKVTIGLSEYGEGDGAASTVAVNKGFALGPDGFVNITFESSDRDSYDRSVQRADANYLNSINDQIDGNPFTVANPAQAWGAPEVNDSQKLLVNFGVALSDSIELEGYFNDASKAVLGGFFYRHPRTRSGVYASGTVDHDNDDTTPNVRRLLIGDLTPGAVGAANTGSALSTGDGVACPTVYVQNTSGAGQYETIDAANATNLASVVSNPNCFFFGELIPDGFTPMFGGDVTDQAFYLGLSGDKDARFTWHVGIYTGSHEADYVIMNTVNASLGPDTPRDFDPGLYGQDDSSFTADFSYAVSDAFQLYFGYESRTEEFTIGAGDAMSYIDGGLGPQGFSTSTNGFPGFSPTVAGTWERENTSFYVDSEIQVSDRLLITAAFRSEDFDLFGTTDDTKVGFNYKATDTVTVRGSHSTGFKAPTPGQQNASNITTQNITRDNVAVLVNRGTIPSIHPVAASVGGRALQPELSTGITAGVSFETSGWDVTVDFFSIEIEDRLALTDTFTLSDTQRASLTSAGIDASDITEFRFFTNNFDTETTGLDIVATKQFGDTELAIAFNSTSNSVTSRDAVDITPEDDTDADVLLISDRRVLQLEDATPETRFNVTVRHNFGNIEVMGRANYWGEFYDDGFQDDVDAAVLVDAQVSFSLGETLDLQFGVNNATDHLPERPSVSGAGLPYSENSPYGFGGQLTYVRASLKF